MTKSNGWWLLRASNTLIKEMKQAVAPEKAVPLPLTKKASVEFSQLTADRPEMPKSKAVRGKLSEQVLAARVNRGQDGGMKLS